MCSDRWMRRLMTLSPESMLQQSAKTKETRSTPKIQIGGLVTAYAIVARCIKTSGKVRPLILPAVALSLCIHQRAGGERAPR